MRNPDFDQLRRVLDHKEPGRATLFEFFLNDKLYARLAEAPALPQGDLGARQRLVVKAFAVAGYDYVTTTPSNLTFPTQDAQHGQSSRSMNDTAVIRDRATLAAYPWQDPDKADFSVLEKTAAGLLKGMKIIIYGPCGVLENTMALMGYEGLCLMLADDPELARDVFDAVGSRLLRMYEIGLQHPAVGAAIVNDDWGFATQTMLSPAQMRQYIFPWQRKMVQAIHRAGRPAILHSCGQLEAIMDEVIDDLKFDGKHSYEDKILPVEQAYERWGKRLAILGGIDLDFVCRSAPAAVEARSRAMFERSRGRGSYALGTGNSVPEYVPQENYFAMTRAALA
jgi:uroporphyrinogen decarboxylase